MATTKSEKSISIPGKKLTSDQFNKSTLGLKMVVEEIVEVSSFRGEFSEQILNCNNEDTINIEFEDGSEWLGPAQDIEEILSEAQKKDAEIRGAENTKADFKFPAYIQSDNNRGVTDFIFKYFRKITGAKIPRLDDFMGKVATKFDEKIVANPGIFKVDENFNLTRVSEIKKTNRRLLLFLHGTASSTLGSFENILKFNKNGLWDAIKKVYKDNIYTLEHHTISASPVQNAIDVIKNLPEGSKVDIISSSRGGIISDLLARCNKVVNQHENFYGFTDEEIAILNDDIKEWEKRHKYTDPSPGLIDELNKQANEKKISVGRVIRVASPSRGTTLISERLDHFLNGLLWCIGKAVGGKANPIYEALKELIVQVISNRKNAEQMPGLNAMIPNSPLQRLLNNPSRTVTGDLLIVEGDAEIGGSIKQSIFVILSNLFYWKANDFVVNTDSMRYGVQRGGKTLFTLSKDNQTHHFNYFKNTNTQVAIKNAVLWDGGDIPKGFDEIPRTEEERGITRILNFKPLYPPKVSGKKPLIIILPGNLATHLYTKDNDVVWTDLGALFSGNLTKYCMDYTLEPKAIFKSFYGRLTDKLKGEGYDVLIMPYDWRQSVSVGGAKLKDILEDYIDYGFPVKILAHSMGGLVAREVMISYPDLWERFQKRDGFKLIMLGTPWKGSYVAVSALFGISKMLNKIVIADSKHSKKKVIQAIQSFQGIYDLLPVDDKEIEDYDKFWIKLFNEAENSELFTPNKTLLSNFKEFKKKASNFKLKDTSNIYYIKGSKRTVYRYKIKESLFGKKLTFPKGPYVNGDGVVSWELGIPKELPKNQIAQVGSEHNFLMDDKKNFDLILHLLTFTSNRDGSELSANYLAPPLPLLPSDPNGEKDHTSIIEGIFGIDDSSTEKEGVRAPLFVSVTHGNLKASRKPVMVGHFEGDGIMSAEAALNSALNNKLEERRLFGTYPEEIGENLALFNPDDLPSGAIIVGLGLKDDLTESLLSITVEKAIINYALHHRDNKVCDNNGPLLGRIVSLSIGSGYGGLNVGSSLNAIVKGVSDANLKVKHIEDGRYVINHVEFIDYYEDMARFIYKELKTIERSNQKHSIEVVGQINKGQGGIKRYIFQKDQGWWHTLTTQSIKEGKEAREVGLKYLSSSGIAKIEASKSFASIKFVKNLIAKFSESEGFDEKTSKTLFELLIPPSLKDILRSGKDIIWKLDEITAGYPWELLYDWKVNKTPTFAHTGLIRQLIDQDGIVKTVISTSNDVLVIGDPIYADLPSLPGAKAEAEAVAEMLNHDFNVTSLINENADVIANELFNSEVKILHIAGHGIYEPETKDKEERIGIVIEDGVLTSGDIAQLPLIPEFVFINCCHLGKIDSKYERYYADRHKLAANIGTQLIKMGVKAIVVAAWAVNDGAAKVFAESLYKYMIEGRFFGEAVKAARGACYRHNRNNATWGAYQCYGSPWYKLVNTDYYEPGKSEYISEEDVIIDLENLYIKCSNMDQESMEDVRNNLKECITKARKSGYHQHARIIELEGNIYNKLGDVKKAISKYFELFSINDASYSVAALEQYCNLLVKDYVQDGVKDPDRRDIILEQIRSLVFIGKTPERLAISGSAHKRFAQIFPKDRLAYLNKMSDDYRLGYELLSHSEPRKYTYTLVNFLTAHYYVNPTTKDISYEGDLMSPKKVLMKVEEYFNQDSLWRNMDSFWEEISDINVWTAQLLYATEYKEIKSRKDKVLQGYKHLYLKYGDPQKLNSEIEHFKFLVEMNNTDKKEKIRIPNQEVKEAIDEILEELEGLKE
ncbi:DUF7379 domain-containing protein [Portibacter marinus]|uniref:DUF7379 domain-containing protein n=1 Tax=Portibacter marinus TaxID=2898660 RepID=UPI001F1EA2D1|nr:CHAT domain-containing protein [Portibacter marinus]